MIRGVREGAASFDRYCVFRHLPKFDERAGLLPLVRRLDAELLEFDFFYEKWLARSWTFGHALRTFGNWYSGSTWNGLSPWFGERRILRAIRKGPGVVHFLWGEFASPRSSKPYHRCGARVVGTFHCSARRLPTVLQGFDPLRRYDFITLMSATQIPFFVERGFPEDRLKVILHGVDANFFRPSDDRPTAPEDKLRLLLMGDTERDHAFAAALFARLSPERFDIAVKTKGTHGRLYRDLPQVRLLPRLSGEQLRAEYQAADLLVLPLLDCTANNAVLESMACGTPVMTNRVGGIGEYVADACNIVMESKDVDAWAHDLTRWAGDRTELVSLRPRVRVWAEQFDWEHIAPKYERVYEEVLGS